MTARLDRTLDRLGLLHEPVRRRIYLFVRAAGSPVSRDEVAHDAGISRKLAAFHLEKLLDGGLVVARFARRAGDKPVGRKPKLYEPSPAPLQVSIPERRYDLIAAVLVDAVRYPGPGETAEDAAYRLARRRGARLGKQIKQHTAAAMGGPALARGAGVLEKHGFDPELRDGKAVLRNCPFKALAMEAPELICGMNHAFIDGLMRGLGDGEVDVALAPTPGGCCVTLQIEGDREETVAAGSGG
ncbi:MAG: helix-turn-helix transcriptional regulator [Actinomycetota bacterium]